MTKFAEIFQQRNQHEQKLDLSEMALGDQAMRVVAEIISQARVVALDLSKNHFSD
jgi:uncharacterized protein YejL (UPF0352 family)